jgi:predicted dehydrogenase
MKIGSLKFAGSGRVDGMNRRDFSRMSALAVAASQLPALAQSPPAASKPVGFAPVGLGTISDIFIKACQSSNKAKITGLVTGHPQEKGPKYAEMYGVPKGSIYTYETYDHIRDNPDIDAVYIGLPNSMHCEYTVRAAEAGKHVLCEKPMAISSAECRKMIDACRKANVKLMIAYRVHYDPTWLHIQQIVRSGELGDVLGFQGGFYGQKKEGEWRLDRKLAGGGSLMDLGIYPMNAIRWLSGEEPSEYHAMVSTTEKGPRFAEVEQTVEFMMKFPSGAIGTAGSSYGMNGPCTLTIDGTIGYLQVQPAFFYSGLKFTGVTKSGPVSEASPGVGVYQFVYEADHFADCIRNNKEPNTPGEEGLKDMVAMEAIYKAAGAPIA